MASKNARVMSVRLMVADIEALDRIAEREEKSRNAIIVQALREKILDQQESESK